MKKVINIMVGLFLIVNCCLATNVFAITEERATSNEMKFSYSYDNVNWTSQETVYHAFNDLDGYYDKAEISLDTTQHYMYIRIDSFIINNHSMTADKITIEFQNSHGNFLVDVSANKTVKIPVSALNVPRNNYNYINISANDEVTNRNRTASITMGASTQGPIFDPSLLAGNYSDANGNYVLINADGSVEIKDIRTSMYAYEPINHVNGNGEVILNKQLYIYTYSTNLLFHYNAETQTLTFDQKAGTNNYQLPAYLVSGTTFTKSISAQSIALNTSKLTLEKASTYQLKATLTPNDSTETVLWSSSAPDIASVDANGFVTTLKEGEAEIRATTSSSALSATCTVKVIKPIEIVKPPQISGGETTDKVQIGVSGDDAEQILKDQLSAILKNEVGSEVITQETKLKLEAALAAGKLISTQVIADVIKEENINKIDKEQIETLIKTLSASSNSVMNLVQYLDLGVQLHAEGEVLGNIHELSQPLSFDVAIPQSLIKGNREFFVIRVHNGVTETLPTHISGNMISFETDKFSTYAIGYSEKKVVETNDNSHRASLYALMSLSMMIMMGNMGKKKYFK